MDIELYTFDCLGCGRCVKRCPSGILKMIDNGMCRFVNVQNEHLCIACRRCEEMCRTKAIRIVG